METTIMGYTGTIQGLYWGYIRDHGKKIETTAGFRVPSPKET